MKKLLFLLLVILQTSGRTQSTDSLYQNVYPKDLVYLGLFDEKMFIEADTSLKGNHLYFNNHPIDSTGIKLASFPKVINGGLYFNCVDRKNNHGIYTLASNNISRIDELVIYHFGFSTNLIFTSDFRSFNIFNLKDKGQSMILDMQKVLGKDKKWFDEDYKIIVDPFWIDDNNLFFSFAECPVSCSNYRHYLFRKSDKSIKELKFLKSKLKYNSDEYTCLELVNSDHKLILGYTDRSLDSNMIGRWIFNDTLKRVSKILSMNQRIFIMSPNGEFNYDAPTILGYNYTQNTLVGTNFRSKLDNRANVIVPYKFSVPQELAMVKVYYDSLLTREEVSSFGKYELSILRNLIFAKHNFKFDSDYWQAYFNLFEFYRSEQKRKSRSKEVEKTFSPIDKKNIDMIRKEEKKRNK